MPRFPLLATVFVLPLLLSAADAAPTIRLTPAKPDRPAAIEVAGLGESAVAAIRKAGLTDDTWPAVLRVVVAEGTAEEIASRPAVAGSYSVTDAAICFEPQFPFVPGVKYQVTFDPAAAKLTGKPITAAVSVPKPPPGPPTSIAAVYPSAARLPENTLRWYVHFSGQMTHGDIYRHVTLVRDDGQEVKHPFLEIDEELWSTDGTRVTLLFHPGRVKRGLVPREQDGPILEEGRRYTLTISRDWGDAEGRPLTKEFRKTFSVYAPDDDPVDPDQWTLIPPRAGSDSPLILRLAEPLDHALLHSMLAVADAAGKPVEGTVTVGGGDRVVTFAPKQRWAKGRYKLVVDTRLEDLCGNRVGEPFEIDVFKPVQQKIEAKTVERPFEVR
jgi:hypothetical protein